MKKIILSAALIVASAGLVSAEDFSVLDQNHDGSLSREEFMQCFDKGDTNKDGKLSSTEHSAIMATKDTERGRLGSIESDTGRAPESRPGSAEGAESSPSDIRSRESTTERKSGVSP